MKSVFNSGTLHLIFDTMNKATSICVYVVVVGGGGNNNNKRPRTELNDISTRYNIFFIQ
jgi:hypothetical protein